jgi:hypothetical protein
MKKTETDFAGDSLLGASTIRGRTDAKIYMAQVSPDDERRLIWSSKRIGRAIPKTFLIFDPTTGKSELGETAADAARNARELRKSGVRTAESISATFAWKDAKRRAPNSVLKRKIEEHAGSR